MPTVAEIAREAFDGAAAELPDVIKAATLERTKRGVYDPAAGTYQDARQTFPCRVLFVDEGALADAFPSYVVGAGDRLAYAEGLTTAPLEGEHIAIGAQSVVITRIGDVVGAGSFFALVVRNA